MKLQIRRADLDSDRNQLVNAFARYLNPRFDATRFNWLYLDNPHGKARAWIAYDAAKSDQIVGAAAAFPRRMYVHEGEDLAWVLGDFCFDPKYCSLGPALQLQRTLFNQVDSGEMSFWYDFPSQKMMAVYRRFHIEPCDQIIRLARPLRVDGKVKHSVQSDVHRKVLTLGGNTLLRVPAAQSKPSKALVESACRDLRTGVQRTRSRGTRVPRHLHPALG